MKIFRSRVILETYSCTIIHFWYYGVVFELNITIKVKENASLDLQFPFICSLNHFENDVCALNFFDQKMVRENLF